MQSATQTAEPSRARGSLPRRAARRVRAGSRRVPAPLAALLAVALAAGLAWALIVPPWQSPDDTSHFAYVQVLAERGELPPRNGASTVSSEENLLSAYTDQAARSAAPAVWDPAVERAWRRAEDRLPDSARSNGGGSNSAQVNPPLYYGYEALAYRAAYGSSVLGRMYAMRVWSALLLLVTVAATWLLAGELFGRNRVLQTAAAGVVALQPMTTFVSAMTNPDSMLIALWSLGLWLGVRVLRRGVDLPSGVALGLIAGLAVLTKATSYALLPAVVLALAVGLWRRRGVPGTARVAVLCALALVVPIGGWIAAAHAMHRAAVNEVSLPAPRAPLHAVTGGQPAPVRAPSGVPSATATPPAATIGNLVSSNCHRLEISCREFARYLQHFYLPHGSLRAAWTGPPDYYWVRGGWGLFGWAEIGLPHRVEVLLRGLSLLALLGGLAFAVTRIRRRRSAAWILVFLVLAAVTLLGLLHWVDYRSMVDAKRAGQAYTGFLQGRYLLPVVALTACGATGAIALLPRRFHPALVGLLLAGMAGLQVLALGVVTAHYYG